MSIQSYSRKDRFARDLKREYKYTKSIVCNETTREVVEYLYKLEEYGYVDERMAKEIYNGIGRNYGALLGKYDSKNSRFIKSRRWNTGIGEVNGEGTSGEGVPEGVKYSRRDQFARDLKREYKYTDTVENVAKELDSIVNASKNIQAEKNNTTTKEGSGEVKHSIRAKFYEEYDAWDKKNPSVTFVSGRTSNILKDISTMVSKGSVNHNSRKFKAENVDGSRTHLNIDYCNEPIKKIYHELFDDALKRYNEKQTRADRRIENYYEKIRNSKQEKPFHELILQIGDKENMSAKSENGQLARQILDEYYRGFQERNPQLKVFSAHLHMDEATPHLHIDFVPFTMGSKRGLDTRVSLKQALAAQGFKGGTRGDTEWSQWVSAEKSALAFIMERHGIEWEHKGSHEKHLSVLDYKKQEREKEVTKLGDEINKKKDKLELVNARIGNLIDCEKSLENVKENFEDDPQYQLPEPPALMSAKTYKTKIAQPIINALKELVQGVVIKYFKMKSTLEEWRQANQSLYHDNNRLSEKAKNLENINAKQKAELQDYKLLRKVFGNKQIDDMLKQAKEITQSKQRGTRFRNDKNER